MEFQWADSDLSFWKGFPLLAIVGSFGIGEKVDCAKPATLFEKVLGGQAGLSTLTSLRETCLRELPEVRSRDIRTR